MGKSAKHLVGRGKGEKRDKKKQIPSKKHIQRQKITTTKPRNNNAKSNKRKPSRLLEKKETTTRNLQSIQNLENSKHASGNNEKSPLKKKK